MVEGALGEPGTSVVSSKHRTEYTRQAWCEDGVAGTNDTPSASDMLIGFDCSDLCQGTATCNKQQPLRRKRVYARSFRLINFCLLEYSFSGKSFVDICREPGIVTSLFGKSIIGKWEWMMTSVIFFLEVDREVLLYSEHVLFRVTNFRHISRASCLGSVIRWAIEI